MRYLVKQVDIAPAGTREEGEAAKNLSVVSSMSTTKQPR